MEYEDESGISGELLQKSSNISQEMSGFMDPRTIKWMLISSSIPITCIILVYLYVIYVAGPRFMKNRQPYSLKMFMQCYNIFQVITNFLLVFNMVTNGRPFTVVWRYCDSFDKICGDNSEKMLGMVWWALILKLIDFIETVVFVLRKKYRQVSVFHVYHHISTAVYVWIILRYLPHGHIMYMLTLNCSVHVIMYSYYFLSTYGSRIQQKISSFKKWLTIIQMTHIVSILLTGLPPSLTTIDCDTKGKYLGFVTFVLCSTNLWFFWDFFKKSYKKSKTA
ncbi:hypothetical protein DMN91_003402 [Ooceraea biroi]|uniref:Elongation of very long chain fatty acids protein n=1 Tax=Ooceraea biroi TaxID=2015173 RepID=A0A026W829_OOCBI|nr:elongation of very long chain fatty acids protein AAEL008004 [Ooceraea biroi]EZA51806.1 Elongation of very long chain fatty acids protein [Ooceraea biroi]RLU23199.1 hypothetical protein DMN91_003402 [Ooceraea biroi]